MKVELTRMTLCNFKGVEYQAIEFRHNTLIRGTNGTGKTTIADAYNWCLYGKNSQGKTVVGEIKRRDGDCQVIHNLEYSVEIEFLIDGETRKFKRLVIEKWTKPKGVPEKILSGHEVTYFVNDMQCATKKEYDMNVNQIANEDVLRIMTEIGYFFSLKEEQQKQHLLRLAFNTASTQEAEQIATEQVLKANADMADFISNLNGEKAELFRKKMRSQINALDTELKTIPKEIVAKQETLPADDDWAMIDARIHFNQDEITKIAAQLKNQNNDLAIAETEKAIADKRLAIAKRTEEITKDITARNKILTDKVAKLQQDVTTQQALQATQQEELNRANATLQTLLARREKLVEQWHDIKAGKIEFIPDELACPTCKRPYDLDSLAQGKLNENVAQGKDIKVQIEQQSKRVALLQENIAVYETAIYTALAELDSAKVPTITEEDIIRIDEPLRDMQKELSKLIAKLVGLKNGLNKPANDELNAKRAMLQSELEALYHRQAGKTQRDIINKQIADLREKQKRITQQIAELEKAEATAIEFVKLRDNELVKRVNSLFSIVSFDFITDQLNGSDKVSCNCYVEGMPYSDRNNAGKVNAGLDIINAFGKHEDLALPIFIDNAESVVTYLATESQKILLVVDGNCNELTIENLQ